MLTLFMIAMVLIGLALVGLSIYIFFHGDFPEVHIGRNKEMRDRGIFCANTTDALERKEYKAVKIKQEKKDKES